MVKKRIGVTDIEANGLYNTISKFHCSHIIDVSDINNRIGYKPGDFKKYIRDLSQCKDFDIFVGHNFIDFDSIALNKLDKSLKELKVFDTLVLSRMLYPERKTHSLKSWGIELGILKGDYGEKEVEEGEDIWATYNDDMYVYCEQDCIVTWHLYHHLCKEAEFDPYDPPFYLIKFDRDI